MQLVITTLPQAPLTVGRLSSLARPAYGVFLNITLGLGAALAVPAVGDYSLLLVVLLPMKYISKRIALKSMRVQFPIASRA